MGAKRAPAASSAPATRLRPSEIWYTFARVRDRFSGCGRTLEETLGEIRDGALRTPSSRLRDVPLRGLPEALRLDAAADLDPSASIGRLKILVRC